MSHVGSSAGSPRDAGPSSPLAHAFAELSRSAQAGEDLPALLRRLPALATTVVPACDEASVSLVDARGRVTTPHATGDVVVVLDQVQYESGGPCVSAVLGETHPVYSADLATDQRWPEFATAAVGRGFGSLYSERFHIGEPVGGINLYARRANAFGDDDMTAATLLAAFAGAVTALTYERVEASNLQQALQTRDIIGQAKGILMERQRVTAGEAFDMLRRASQHQNRKLRDLAEDIATTGEEPPDLR